MSKEIETWRDIPGHEGRYRASTLGRIQSVERRVMCSNGHNRLVREKIFMGITDAYGYKKFAYREGKLMPVHRAVAICFLPNPNGWPDVNHKDGNKANNRVENLEWCTESHNMLHSYQVLGRRSGRLGKKGKLSSHKKSIIKMDMNDNVIAIYDTITEGAESVGGKGVSLSNSINGYNKPNYKGFKWRLANG